MGISDIKVSILQHFNTFFVLAAVIFLVVALYREWFNPAFTFFICVVAFLLTGILTPLEALRGFANPEIIVIFLLMMVTAGIRAIFGPRLFAGLFTDTLHPKRFLLGMMVSASGVSALINNTPIVAFLIPYVKDWADRAGQAASKFLIPLSFATMMGGMITVVGTSTNLVLVGLMSEYGVTPLHFTDFLYLGLLVTITGIAYLYLVGYRLLPEREDRIDALRGQLKEYIVETELYAGSPLAGKTVHEAGLRSLKDLFLAEIIRGERVITPVAPDVILEERDTLFFSGNTSAVLRFLNEGRGLQLPLRERLGDVGHFHFTEAVIPANSGLIGVRIKDSDFRRRFNASIVAIHRNGKRIPGRVGEVELAGGDFLLLLSDGKNPINSHDKDLYILAPPTRLGESRPKWHVLIGIAAFALLVCGITGVLPLFHASLAILVMLLIAGILHPAELRRQFDAPLFLVLACSLAVGVALEKSGVAALIASLIISAGEGLGGAGLISLIFLATTLLTSLITNPAAVAMMFPIALSMSEQSGLPTTPFFVAIAFAASGSFMTPFGYQTNLMVYGPGGYTFRDFLRVGVPLTLVYAIVCIAFILTYYEV